MSGNGKYIYAVVDSSCGEIDAMIIFPNYLTHSNIAKNLSVLKVHSAGFVDEDRCYGESASLGVRANPERDNKILRWLLKGD